MNRNRTELKNTNERRLVKPDEARSTKKEYTDTFEVIREALAEFDSKDYFKTDAGTKFIDCILIMFMVLYFMIFLVPDSTWLNIGVNLPNENDISDFVWLSMHKTSFPVSVFIFFKLTPLFFIIILFLSIVRINRPYGYQRFLRNREKQIKRKYWHKSLIGCAIILYIAPLWVWLYPASGILEFDSPIVPNPYHNRLLFFIFFGLFMIAISGFTSMLYAELRFHLTRKEV